MADTPIAARDPVANLNSVLSLFSGGSQTTTTGPSTSSTKSNLTADQLNALIADAMAPLNQASHGAGLSTYSDTNLALGRAQVAAKIGAQTAGTTTTESGKTSTTTKAGTLTQPGAMKSILAGTGASMLLSPVLKGVSKGVGIDKMSKGIEDAIASSLASGTTNLGGGLAVDATGSITGGSTAEAVSGLSLDPELATLLGLDAGTTGAAVGAGAAADMAAATTAGETAGAAGAAAAGTEALAGDAVAGEAGAALADGAVFDPTSAMVVGGALAADKLLGTNIAGSVGGAIEDTGNVVSDFISNPLGGGGGGGCFLTTAAVEHQGLPDDCEELETLRKFRDHFMLQSAELRQEVYWYYKHAPAIVEKLKAMENSPEIYNEMWNTYILPAVHAVKSYKYETAYSIYKELVHYVQKEVGTE
jgi:hypothetical protein